MDDDIRQQKKFSGSILNMTFFQQGSPTLPTTIVSSPFVQLYGPGLGGSLNGSRFLTDPPSSAVRCLDIDARSSCQDSAGKRMRTSAFQRGLSSYKSFMFNGLCSTTFAETTTSMLESQIQLPSAVASIPAKGRRV